MTNLAALTPEEREHILAEITETIVRLRAPEKIILFGSLAAGTPTGDSDVDLVIIQETDLNRFDRPRGIWPHVAHLRVPMDVMVYTPREWEEMKDQVGLLPYEVQRMGRVLYERESLFSNA